MNTFVLVQIIGIITLIISVILLQQQKKENLLILQAISFFTLAIQYFLTNKITGVAISIIIIIRNVVFLYHEKKNLKPSATVLGIFQVITLSSIYFTWQNVFSILSPVATMVISWGVWQNNMTYARRSLLLGKIGMFIYNLTAGMYTATLTNGMEITSVIIAMWRYDRKNKTIN